MSPKSTLVGFAVLAILALGFAVILGGQVHAFPTHIGSSTVATTIKTMP